MNFELLLRYLPLCKSKSTLVFRNVKVQMIFLMLNNDTYGKESITCQLLLSSVLSVHMPPSLVRVFNN